MSTTSTAPAPAGTGPLQATPPARRLPRWVPPAVFAAALAVVALLVVPPAPGALTVPLLVASAAVAVTAYLVLAVLPLLSARPA